MCNPYLAFALLIYAGLDGIRRQMELPKAADINFFSASEEVKSAFKTLPATLAQAKAAAESSAFIADILPPSIIDYYTR